jgi:hypothetical protein
VSPRIDPRKRRIGILLILAGLAIAALSVPLGLGSLVILGSLVMLSGILWSIYLWSK